MTCMKFAALTALLAAGIGCSSSSSPGGDTGTSRCGGSGSTGNAAADSCIAQNCCAQLEACEASSPCSACLAGTNAECGSDALHAEFWSCAQQHACVGGGGCSPESCLAAISAHPAGCAEATCEDGQCVYRARDADSDGQRSKFCKDTTGKAQVEVGDDCDDESPIRYSGAWDGPFGDGQEDRCDGIDQSCSGTADDDVLTDGTSCSCKPGAIAQCAATSGGKPITWPTGEPVGECTYGSRECEEDAATGGGRWGPCIGAVEPALEDCNGKDDDCDGQTDEDAVDPTVWECDEDSDGHLADSAITQQSCTQPQAGCSGTWRAGGPHDDCDDSQALVFAGSAELCDGHDNDCNGTTDDNPVNPTTWYPDADNDGHGDAHAQPTTQCNRPGAHWKSFDELDGHESDDCDDSLAAVNPSAWDGPAKYKRSRGVKAPGWHAKIYALQPPASCNWACAGQLAATAFQSGTPLLERDDLLLKFDWGKGAVDPDLPALTDYFAVRWTAQVDVTTAGGYRFRAQGNQGVRMRLKPASSGSFATIIDNWSGDASVVESALQDLQAGTYDVEVDLFEAADTAFLWLSWEGPNFGSTMLRVMHDPVGGSADDSCDQIDNDCSGQPDDAVARDVTMPSLTYGCVDTPEECDPWAWDDAWLTEACMDPVPAPPAGTPCHAGVRACLPSGRWSGCAGWIHAQPFDACDNQVDDDCNGVVDDASGTATWYYDGDDDGYRCSGSTCPATKVQCGDPGDHWVQWDAGDPVDCNDAVKLINPKATEICNNLDDDCDGAVDHLDDNLVGGTTYYYDGDKDGHGKPGAQVIRCQSPGAAYTTSVASNEDCDDTKKLVYKGAPERCDNTDNDCDGSKDEGDVCYTCVGLQGSIQVRAGSLIDGADADFGGNGPAMYTKMSYAIQSALLKVDVDLVARETKSNYTTGHGEGVIWTGLTPGNHPICAVGVDNGAFLTYTTNGKLVTGPSTIVGIGDLQLLYTDDDHTVDTQAKTQHWTWTHQYTCYGDTAGDDVCTSSDCTRCTVDFTGCLMVQLCPLGVD